MVIKEKRKKKMTLDDFAAAIQKDYLTLGKQMETGFKSIREDMATKEDIRKIRNETATHSALVDVHDDVKRLNEMMVSKADLAETIRRELDASPFAREADVKDLRDRLLRVEEKLAMKPNRRAA
jgi:hypothetical protein